MFPAGGLPRTVSLDFGGPRAGIGCDSAELNPRPPKEQQ